MATKNTNVTDWTLNSDIYDIMGGVNEVKKHYMEDETETTLNLGIFGFVSDIAAKEIQINTIMAGQLGNEMFPSRARLTKNVLTHAIFSNIQDINAVPAHMTITFCIKDVDFIKYMKLDDDDNDNGTFYLDCDSPIFIGDFEFHPDYDIKIHRVKIKTGDEDSNNDRYAYSAEYIIDEEGKPKINRLSNIKSPYIKQPFEINYDGVTYIAIQTIVRQVSILEIEDKILTTSIIANKTYQFAFDNQLADFSVIVTDNGVATELTPYMMGETAKTEPYCWYTYVSENVVRVTFDSLSYIPGLNSDIYIRAYTTLGQDGNFSYLKIDSTQDGFYVDIGSSQYGYSRITCYTVAITDSLDGKNRKTKEELQKLLPKANLARGAITTETDVNNYFNLIDDENNRLLIMKKTDNQLNRIWYGYFLLKDQIGNIIPTNSICIAFSLTEGLINGFVSLCDDGRYVVPCGSVVRYNPDTKVGAFIGNGKGVPEPFSSDYYEKDYYYTTIYDIILTRDPLYSSIYLSIYNNDSFFVYKYVCKNSDVQFIANRLHFERKLLSDQSLYTLSFKIAKSINDGRLMIFTETNRWIEDGQVIEEEIETQNLRVVLVLYDGEDPYRWIEIPYDRSIEIENAIYPFKISLETDNNLDDHNRLSIINMNEAGSTNQVTGFVDENMKAQIYIIAKITTDPTKEYPRMELDNITDYAYEDYIVTNIYEIEGGLHFFTNFTKVIDCRIDAGTDDTYLVSYIPVVGYHYLNAQNQEGEANVKYFLNALNERKDYIDYCLELLENNMVIDFKFFNTYGPSITYTLDDESTLIGSIDITLTGNVSLKSSTDIYTVPSIISDIKAYIEDLYETGNLYTSNLVTYITDKYNDRINYFEFTGFNGYDANEQRIINIISEDPATVPEFINIRNVFNSETGLIEPNIKITIV